MLSSVLLGITDNVFNGRLLRDMTLKIPAKSIDLYKAADVWSLFGTIEGLN